MQELFLYELNPCAPVKHSRAELGSQTVNFVLSDNGFLNVYKYFTETKKV